MAVTEKHEKPVPDKYTGLFKGSHGGTELLYRTLTTRLGAKYMDKFQIICSRFRELEPGKMPILWLHELAEDPESLRLRDPSFRRQFRKLVFVSDWQFSLYNQGLRVPYSGSIILKNAIDPLPACEKPKGVINFIYHTTPHRGLEILVPVFIELAKQFANIHLDVFSSFDAYGWGFRDKPYGELFELCRSHPQITYHGYQPNEVVREALLKAHVFAYPCMWKETSCLAALEAMSAGTLVICPNLGGLPETVSNYGCMYHFDENTTVHARMFYSVLQNLMGRLESEPLVEVRRTAKGRVDRFFSWEKRLPEWEYLLDSLR
jgi:UDP-glucose:(glucosyl)LPS alpha-1,2-glucosyltransferase